MTRPIPQDEHAEREAIGCMLYGCHDPYLRWHHFRHGGRRLIHDWLSLLRRHGHLYDALAESDYLMQYLAASANAVMLVDAVERLRLWHYSPGIRHELLVECLAPIGDWHIEHFMQTVGTLIRLAETRAAIERHEREIAALRAGVEA